MGQKLINTYSLDGLELVYKCPCFIYVKFEYDAPVSLVFRAYEQLKHHQGLVDFEEAVTAHYCLDIKVVVQ